MVGDDTPDKHRNLKPAWEPGKSGNPAGRPKGARSKLTEDFLSDVLEAWQTSGKQAIVEMVADKPGDFVKMVAGLIPKEATLNINTAEDLTDDELIERIRNLGQAIAGFLPDGTGNAHQAVEGEAGQAIAPRVH